MVGNNATKKRQYLRGNLCPNKMAKHMGIGKTLAPAQALSKSVSQSDWHWPFILFVERGSQLYYNNVGIYIYTVHTNAMLTASNNIPPKCCGAVILSQLGCIKSVLPLLFYYYLFLFYGALSSPSPLHC